VRVKVIKNKVAPPFKQAEFDIMFNEGISTSGDLLDTAVEQNLVTKSGAFYTYKTTKIGQGRENAKQFLKDNAKVLEQLKSELTMGDIKVVESKAKVSKAA